MDPGGKKTKHLTSLYRDSSAEPAPSKPLSGLADRNESCERQQRRIVRGFKRRRSQWTSGETKRMIKLTQQHDGPWVDRFARFLIVIKISPAPCKRCLYFPTFIRQSFCRGTFREGTFLSRAHVGNSHGDRKQLSGYSGQGVRVRMKDLATPVQVWKTVKAGSGHCLLPPSSTVPSVALARKGIFQWLALLYEWRGDSLCLTKLTSEIILRSRR